MRVLGKYDLDNAVLLEDLKQLLESYGVVEGHSTLNNNQQEEEPSVAVEVQEADTEVKAEAAPETKVEVEEAQPIETPQEDSREEVKEESPVENEEVINVQDAEQEYQGIVNEANEKAVESEANE